MRPGGGNKKGGAYERKINKMLSLWLSDGEKQDLFTRSSMSGGRATVHKKKGDILHNEAGDSTAIDPLSFAFTSIFFLEYKCYNNLNILLYIFKQGGKVKSFWDTAAVEAYEYGKQPLLIFKQNFSPDMILITKKGLKHFDRVEKYKMFKVCIAGKYIFHLETFLKCYKFKKQ